ncbi:hypothetical protein ACDY95_29270, partial [Achromobacter ruhlandii]|uniref:hypothetical protein n=1 Tax=Achromobacter ruhlandii TaxID=72557 RepID=UPI003558DB59
DKVRQSEREDSMIKVGVERVDNHGVKEGVSGRVLGGAEKWVGLCGNEKGTAVKNFNFFFLKPSPPPQNSTRL